MVTNAFAFTQYSHLHGSGYLLGVAVKLQGLYRVLEVGKSLGKIGRAFSWLESFKNRFCFARSGKVLEFFKTIGTARSG